MYTDQFVMVPPPSLYTSPCVHPIPEVSPTEGKEGVTLTNREVYTWLSDYQTALDECNGKIESIQLFYERYDEKTP